MLATVTSTDTRISFLPKVYRLHTLISSENFTEHTSFPDINSRFTVAEKKASLLSMDLDRV